MNVTIELPDIEGYEYTGEWRAPKIGELYMHNDDVHCCELVMELDVPILKKKAPVYKALKTDEAGSFRCYVDGFESMKFVEIKAL